MKILEEEVDEIRVKMRLSGEKFQVEVNGEEKISELKSKVAAVRPELPSDCPSAHSYFDINENISCIHMSDIIAAHYIAYI